MGMKFHSQGEGDLLMRPFSAFLITDHPITDHRLPFLPHPLPTPPSVAVAFEWPAIPKGEGDPSVAIAFFAKASGCRQGLLLPYHSRQGLNPLPTNAPLQGLTDHRSLITDY